ncbi:type II toxin-antitoxin system VapC family toxin [Haliea atlantica]|nr:VapC toxin family PIN domain ribonuclease [Haliea sp.]
MIVLDTHVLVWWVNHAPQLSSAASAAIEQELQSPVGLVAVSAITAWEIAMLVSLGRLSLTMGVDDWISEISAVEGLQFLPVDTAVAIESTRLPGQFHKDPADRMIVALARHLNAPLLTADEKIRHYEHVRTLW